MPAEAMVEQEMSGTPEVGYWLDDSRETTRGCRPKVLKRFARWLEKEGTDWRCFLQTCKADPNGGELALRGFHNSLIAEQLAPSTANVHYHVGTTSTRARRSTGSSRSATRSA